MGLSALLEQMALAGLGTSVAKPERCLAGGVHTVWHVRTERADYAVKLLDRLALEDRGRTGSVRAGEYLAREARDRGFPAVPALANADGDVVWDAGEAGALVYPWVEGAVSHRCSRRNAITIARVLRNLHDANLPSRELLELRRWTLPDATDWDDFARHGRTRDADWTNDLLRTLPVIRRWTKRYAALGDKRTVVVTHGDIVPDNVIWVDDIPHIVDWEFAGPTDRDADVVNTALAWSARPQSGIDSAAFSAFWTTYAAGAVDVASALTVCAARVIAWLSFDIDRRLRPEYVGEAHHLRRVFDELHLIDAVRRPLPELTARLTA
jgi:Ser/Thr protein kinase RdoA (MazF antagonist)